MRRSGRPADALVKDMARAGATAAEPSVEQSVVQPSSRRRHREPAADGGVPKRTKVPLYPRLLRLRHVHPNAWQRAALGEGALGAAVLLVLADLATAWTLIALPVAVAVVVKAHDGLAGVLEQPAPAAPTGPPDP